MMIGHQEANVVYVEPLDYKENADQQDLWVHKASEVQ
jgi:hypothetical protein